MNDKKPAPDYVEALAMRIEQVIGGMGVVATLIRSASPETLLGVAQQRGVSHNDVRSFGSLLETALRVISRGGAPAQVAPDTDREEENPDEEFPVLVAEEEEAQKQALTLRVEALLREHALACAVRGREASIRWDDLTLRLNLTAYEAGRIAPLLRAVLDHLGVTRIRTRGEGERPSRFLIPSGLYLPATKPLPPPPEPPPLTPPPPTTRRFSSSKEKARYCYTRKAQGVMWSAVAREVGFTLGQAACTCARRLAAQQKWPWPPQSGPHLQIPPEPMPESPPMTTGPAQAYLLRQKGLSWTQIAQRTGYQNQGSACVCAKEYAQRAKLPWPVPLPDRPHRSPPREPGRWRVAYEARKEGKTWEEAAKAAGYGSAESAQARVRSRARALGWQWPIPPAKPPDPAPATPKAHPPPAPAPSTPASPPPSAPPPSSPVTPQAVLIPPPAWGEAAYQCRSWGHSWARISACLGKTSLEIEALAQRYAQSKQIPWPPRKAKEAPSRPDCAYHLRIAGLSWSQIASLLRYANANVAKSACHAYAAGALLPWPPPRGSGEER